MRFIARRHIAIQPLFIASKYVALLSPVVSLSRVVGPLDLHASVALAPLLHIRVGLPSGHMRGDLGELGAVIRGMRRVLGTQLGEYSNFSWRQSAKEELGYVLASCNRARKCSFVR